MNPSRRELLGWSALASLSHVVSPTTLWGAVCPSEEVQSEGSDSIFLQENFAPAREETT
ncbi:hypothetical protein K2X85_07600 [bacterium]|nr:hypothetical protein [bacterium]